MYDGFYAVITNLEGEVGEILKINRQRWEIEENFRIMKTEFEARPIIVKQEDSIKAYFLTCYIILLVYRMLEKKLGEEFTCSGILKSLREMNIPLLSKDSGYIPSYKRTKLTDAPHTGFSLQTDYEFISKIDMRAIIKKQNRKKSTISKIVHIDAKKKTATPLINTRTMAVLGFIKCQRWEYNRFIYQIQSYNSYPIHP